MPPALETALVALAWITVVAFLGWLLLVAVVRERLAIIFFLNALCHLAIFVLPLALLIGLLAGNLPLTLAAAAAIGVWLYRWGRPLLPRALRGRRAVDGGHPLSIATFNLLWINDDLDAIVAAIRDLDTDLVGIQELSPAHQAAFAAHLSDLYPHQLFRPGPRATGIALLSRLPIDETGEHIEDTVWLGAPLIASLDLDGRNASIVVFHAASVMVPAAARERQARKLVDYAERRDGPVVLLGDFNATSASAAYAILARDLQDAWHAGGWGFGHTFPGSPWSPVPGGVRPPLPRRLIPNWLVRIDYVFLTAHWHAHRARTARLYGSSDHRPLIAELLLLPERTL